MLQVTELGVCCPALIHFIILPRNSVAVDAICAEDNTRTCD